MRDRHLDHFVKVTQGLATQWASRRQAQADASFEREWDNIRAAFSWTLALGDFVRADVLITATGSHADSRIIHEHGDWVNRALDQCARAGSPPSASMFGWAAHWTGFVTGDQQKAIELANEGIRLARSPSDPSTAICWEMLCAATLAAGRVGEDPIPFRGAEAAMAEVTSPFERSRLGRVLLEEAFYIDHSRVGARLAELQDLADRVGAPWLLTEAAYFRGRYLMWIQQPPNPEGALRAYEEGLEIAALCERSLARELAPEWTCVHLHGLG